MQERIQKILSECGYCSRRKAEELIAAGRVRVNGRGCSLGDRADIAEDIISVDGVNVDTPLKRELVYYMLNKPRGYVTTTSDELERRCVMDLLKDVPERVFPVGRLDRNSEGLLILTNDGDFANRIMHPSGHVPKTYRVTVRPDITEEQLTQLSEGVVIDGQKTLPATAQVITKEEGRAVVQLTIREGRNRQIRKMCEAVGLEVARLKRTSVGPLRLGMLKPGEYRELTPQEVASIKNSIKKGENKSVADNKKRRR